MSSISVVPIPAFNDNYIWCMQRKDLAVVVDPGDAKPVIKYCDANGLKLSAIIITHHHWDHTGGIADLLDYAGDIPVYGPNNQIKNIQHRLGDGDTVHIDALDTTFSVMTVPGHTLDHIAYYAEFGLFCGDTLFSGGCGRLFEGTPAQMHNSPSKLMALPAETPVYCTHEYTMANLQFALAVEPNNQDLIDYRQWAQGQRDNDKPTLPSSLGRERQINPYVRVDQPDVIAAAANRSGHAGSSPEDVLATIRAWKDTF